MFKMPRRGENIYHRKDGLWEARYVKSIDCTGKKKYGSVYAHSYREVKEKRQDLISKIALLPQSISAGKMTVNRLIEEWLFINQGRIKEISFQKYCAMYENHIKNDIGNHPIIYLNPILIRQYVEEKLKYGLSPSTINGILTLISTCLKYGHRQYSTPLIDIVYLKQPRKEMRVLSVDEQNKLVSFLLQDMDIYKLGVLFALYTGIRIGELCALTWGDIKDGTVKISKTMQRLSKGKGNGTELIITEPKTPTSNRIIPLPSFLIPIIEPFRSDDEHYVMSTSEKPLIEPRLLQYHFKQHIKALGFPKVNFHALRHSFASRCAAKHFDIRSLAEILGHSNVNITMNRYVHSSFELKTGNMEKLSLFL